VVKRDERWHERVMDEAIKVDAGDGAGGARGHGRVQVVGYVWANVV
jgi:hypothetical protein